MEIWSKLVAPYQVSKTGRSIWQMANTLIPFAVIWVLIYKSLTMSRWVTLGLIILEAGFLIRSFIIFHDCGHGSFFKSKKVNDIVGTLTGFLMFTPYLHWKWEHAGHHATSGNLDKRGIGDLWTLTVKEYQEAKPLKRLTYRLVRNPIGMFFLAPLFLFTVAQRFYSPKAPRKEKWSVHWTTLGFAAIVTVFSLTIGLKAFLMIQIPLIMITGTIGVWLFYVQHQFEDVYWERQKSWNYPQAAIKGSSYLKLPKVLQWFTGNIGFHHVHHLSPRIPNYLLEKCHRELTLFADVKPVTIMSSFRLTRLTLWDEDGKQMVSFKKAKNFNV